MNTMKKTATEKTKFTWRHIYIYIHTAAIRKHTHQAVVAANHGHNKTRPFSIANVNTFNCVSQIGRTINTCENQAFRNISNLQDLHKYLPNYVYVSVQVTYLNRMSPHKYSYSVQQHYNLLLSLCALLKYVAYYSAICISLYHIISIRKNIYEEICDGNARNEFKH